MTLARVVVDWHRTTASPCRLMLDLEGHKTFCGAPVPREVCPFANREVTPGAVNVRVIDGPCPYHHTPGETTFVTPRDWKEALMDDFEDSNHRLDLIRRLEQAGWQVSETIVWNTVAEPSRVLTLSRREVFVVSSTRLEALERAVSWADARLSSG